MVSRLERVSLREVWAREPDFVRWLESNIDVLGETVDLTLTPVERERAVGAFSVDLVAESSDGTSVAIEAQYGRSDHDHLGKLITYLTGLEAKTGIWISEDPRPEHVTAVTWLNSTYDASLYVVKLEAIRIGESPAAPLMTQIVGPSEEGREVGATRREVAAHHDVRYRFWDILLRLAAERTTLHSAISPGQSSWVGATAGKPGLTYNYGLNRHRAMVELYVDRGPELELQTQQIYEQLHESRQRIEESFGEGLFWSSVEGRRACRIGIYIETGGWDDEDRWPELQSEMIETMLRFDRALSPHINELEI